jgi:hypothetical protein
MNKLGRLVGRCARRLIYVCNVWMRATARSQNAQMPGYAA